MKEIQSLNNELIKKVCKLKDKKERYMKLAERSQKTL